MKVTVSFDKRQIARFRKKSIEVMQQIISVYVENMADFVLGQAQSNLQEDPETKADDTGALVLSGTSRREGNDKMIVGFGGEQAKDYVLAVEFGTDPGHRPPVGPLIAWARRVGIPKPEKVAWAIVKTIEKNGLRSRPFLRNAVETAFKEAPRIWKEANESYKP